MRVLLLGAGTVGEAIAALSRGRPWLERLVVADVSLPRAQRAAARLGDPDRAWAVRVDARDEAGLGELIAAEHVDVVVNAVDPRFVMPIFRAALAGGTTYLDMAMSLSRPDPVAPDLRPGIKLGDEQFALAPEWERRGQLALVGMGMDPGLSDVFAAYAARHLVDEVEAIHVRDGGDLRVEGYPFATVFSIWTTIEECLNPPVVWERERGWYTLAPFAEPESFPFPEGVGPRECVHVEHEEVLLVPRWIDCGKVTFKYALDAEFISALKLFHAVGLDRTTPVRVGEVEVAPRDLLAALLPDPATLADRMVGRAIVGTWVIGQRGGERRSIFLYQMAEAEETRRRWGLQPVAWQTGFNPVLAMELLAEGAWSGVGVLGPEAFDPDPYLALMDREGIHHALAEIPPDLAG